MTSTGSGIPSKKKKCCFLQTSVEYVGHRVDAEEISLLPDKLAAIEKAPLPQNVQQLRSFLGLIKFLPNLATTLHPLNELLQKGRKWAWTPESTEVC